ncbi:MAG: hypothetical protein WCK51_00210 [Armatimonadota bacterium]
MKFTRTVLAVSALALTLSAYAADITGKWTGKINMDMKEAKAAAIKAAEAGGKKMTPEQVKMMDQQMAMGMSMVSGIRMNAVLMKGGKYTMTTTGGPGAQKPQTEEGTWTMKGNQVTMTGSKSSKGPKTLVGTLSSNGKTITFDVSKQAQEQASKSGAPKGMKTPSVSIVFTKN